MVECLPGMCKALGLIPITAKKNEEGKEKEKKNKPAIFCWGGEEVLSEVEQERNEGPNCYLNHFHSALKFVSP